MYALQLQTKTLCALCMHFFPSVHILYIIITSLKHNISACASLISITFCNNFKTVTNVFTLLFDNYMSLKIALCAVYQFYAVVDHFTFKTATFVTRRFACIFINFTQDLSIKLQKPANCSIYTIKIPRFLDLLSHYTFTVFHHQHSPFSHCQQ